MTEPVDTSGEAVEALALGCEHYSDDWLILHSADLADTLRALAAERDALRAALRTLIGISNELSWSPKTRPIAARVERIISDALLGSKGNTP